MFNIWGSWVKGIWKRYDFGNFFETLKLFQNKKLKLTDVICNIKINIYYRLCPCFLSYNSKTLGIFRSGVSFWMLVRWLVAQGSWIASGEGLLPGKPTRWLEGWNIQPQPPGPQGRGEGLQAELTTNGQSFNQSCRQNKTSIKNPNHRQRFRELPGCWKHKTAQRVARPEDMEAPHPFPQALPYVPPPSCCSWLVSFYHEPAILVS